MATSYETDVVAWANEQAALLRSGQLSKLDIEHIAEEIEEVGKSERFELANRMTVLLMHLLKWKFQPGFRGSIWDRTIKTQRKAINKRLQKTPSLKPLLLDDDWLEDVWDDAVTDATRETGLDSETFPESCPWSMTQVLTEGWLPG